MTVSTNTPGRSTPSPPPPRRPGTGRLRARRWLGQRIDPAHWRFVAELAVASQTAVRVPIYPLVPWGTAGEVVPWVAGLVQADIDAVGAENSYVLGDSAGGQIALSAVIWLRDNGGQQPRRAFLIAPALDLSLTNPAIAAVEPTDPWLSAAGVHEYVRHWRGTLSVQDPQVSPLADTLTGLTAITMFSGTRDIPQPGLAAAGRQGPPGRGRHRLRRGRPDGARLSAAADSGGRAARRRITDTIMAES